MMWVQLPPRLPREAPAAASRFAASPTHGQHGHRMETFPALDVVLEYCGSNQWFVRANWNASVHVRVPCVGLSGKTAETARLRRKTSAQTSDAWASRALRPTNRLRTPRRREGYGRCSGSRG